MKKLFSTKFGAFSLIFALFLSIGFYSCGDDDEIVVDLKVDYESTTIDLTVSNEQIINILEGNGGYGATSADNKVATATVEGTKVKIKGIGEGQTKVTIVDQKNQKKVFTVNVKDVIVDLTVDRESPIALIKGQSVEVNITSGNGGYEAKSSDAKVAKATITDNKVKIEALAIGESVVTITDKKGKKVELTVNVDETVELTLDPKGPLNLIAEDKIEVTIASGNGEYVVKSSNDKIVKATLEGSKIIIEALAAGESVITVTDKKEKKAELTVNVTAIAELTIDKTSPLKLNTGESVDVTIKTGNGEYVAKSSDEKIAKVSVTGTKVKVEGIAAGTATITITDKKNKKVELTVNVEKVVVDLTIDKESPLKVNTGESVEVTIKTGNGGYAVKSSDEAIAKATLTDSKVKIEGIAQGTATITITDAEGKKVELTVNVEKKIYDLIVDKSIVSIVVKKTSLIKITSGNGDYTATTSDANIATAEINENNITVTAINVGTATITLKDGAGKEKEINVTVVNEDAVDRLDGTKWQVAEGPYIKAKTNLPAATTAIEKDVALAVFLAAVPDMSLEFNAGNVHIIYSGATMFGGKYKINGDKITVYDTRVETVPIWISLGLALAGIDINTLLPDQIELPLPEGTLEGVDSIEMPLDVTRVFNADKMAKLAEDNNNPAIASAKVENVTLHLTILRK